MTSPWAGLSDESKKEEPRHAAFSGLGFSSCVRKVFSQRLYVLDGKLREGFSHESTYLELHGVLGRHVDAF